MMKHQSSITPIVSAKLALAAFVSNTALFCSCSLGSYRIVSAFRAPPIRLPFCCGFNEFYHTMLGAFFNDTSSNHFGNSTFDYHAWIIVLYQLSYRPKVQPEGVEPSMFTLGDQFYRLA